MNTEKLLYVQFEKEVEAARLSAAKFHRVDLHTHTLDSFDYPQTHVKEGFVTEVPSVEQKIAQDKDEEEFKRRFIDAAKSKGLSLIAITDHNEADLASEISSLSDSDLIILPGIEIHVQTNFSKDSEIHILAIFPRNTTSKEIDKVFPADDSMPPSGQRAGRRTEQTIGNVLENIKNLRGISIAAHVNSDKGIRTVVHSQNIDWLKKNYRKQLLIRKEQSTGLSEEETEELVMIKESLKPLSDDVQNEYLEFLSKQNFTAIQIQKPAEREYYEGDHVDALGIPPIPCVVASDAHTIEDIGAQGHGTYLKMSELSLSGIRKAFFDPGTRIRFDNQLPNQNPPRILGIAFEGGSFDEAVIGFSDNLTTLIGSRGTGKSALIEAIRYLMGNDIDKLPPYLKNPVEQRRKFTLRDTEIKMLFEDAQGERYVLKRRLDEGKTDCFNLAGEVQTIDIANSAAIQAEIYGWSEIEELSDSPRKQLELLDGTIDNSQELKLEIERGVELLEENKQNILASARNIETLLPTIADEGEIRTEFTRLTTPELNDAFKEHDSSEDGKQGVKEIKESINGLTSEIISEAALREMDDGIEKVKQDKDKLFDRAKDQIKNLSGRFAVYPWNDEFIEELGKCIDEIKTDYYSLLEKINTLKRSIADKEELANTHHKGIEEKLNAIAEESGESDFSSALARRKELTTRLSRIDEFKRQIQQNDERIEELLKERYEVIYPKISDERQKLFEARQEKAGEISKKLKELRISENIQIEIRYQGDNSAFIEKLGQKDGPEGLLKGSHNYYFRYDFAGFYGEKFTVDQFVKMSMKLDSQDEFMIRYVRERFSGKIVRVVSGRIEENSDIITEFGDNEKVINTWTNDEYEFYEMADGQRMWNHISPYYSGVEHQKHLDSVKLEKLLNLEGSDMEDLIQIRLDDRLVDELSPGERCSALIPIVLVEGNTPIIIDQPEDNLDNKRVFDLVVEILRGLKEQRQIILATHNPNIPVSGDAELVIVFEAPDKNHCVPIEQGSIDKKEVITQIKNIMEGGNQAFDMRMKKYGFIAN